MTIECLNLESIYSKSLARPIFSEVNLKINPGEFVVLLGLNGAGKSTLLRSLLGLTPVKRGEIKINDLTVTAENINQIRRHLGFISQGGGLVKQLSTLDNVLCGCLGDCPPWQTLWGFPSEVQKKAIRLLTELGLQEQIHQKTSRLSGGQQQRVAIARALMQEPKILIADEPLAGLDVMAAQQVMEIFAKLHKEKGITIVMVLHDLGIASVYPERAIILDQGHIVYDGNCQHLQQKFSEFTYN